MTEGAVPVTEVVRSNRVESRHWGVAAVVDPTGRLLARAGNPDVATYLRSAAKPVQLLTMIEQGLERNGGLSEEELAVSAASHGGEPGHVAAVRGFLARVGLGEDRLLCGAHAPLDPDAAATLAASGTRPGAVHNNCSGKHAAMLATCVARGWPLEAYIERDHPLQVAIHDRLSAFVGAQTEEGVDGCGVPTYYVTVHQAALMAARLMALAEQGGAAERVVAAMTSHPWYTSGSKRLAYRVMEALPGVLAKEGAEGFFLVGIPRVRSRWGTAAGLALKVLDGGGEDARGREPAVASALLSLGVPKPNEREAIAALARVPLHNVAGRQVGEIVGLLRPRNADG